MKGPRQEIDWYGLYPATGSRDDVLFPAVRRGAERPNQLALLEVERDPVVDTVTHPAKMALPLLRKILETLLEWGWVQPGGVVVDPFGGRGSTAAVWCAMDPRNQAVTVEIEEHFVRMQEQVKAHAEKRLGRPLAWTILHGDSRRCDELLQESGVGVTSPPYGTEFARQHNGSRGGTRGTTPSERGAFVSYGTAAGQIEGLPDPVAVTSPPYGDTEVMHVGHCIGDAWAERGQAAIPAEMGDKRTRRYGVAPGQIGQLPHDLDVAVTSPPYEDSVNDRNGIDVSRCEKAGRTSQAHGRGYSHAVACTSPPYEGSLASDDPERRGGLFRDPKRKADRTLTNGYSAVASPPYEGEQPCQCQKRVLQEGYEGIKHRGTGGKSDATINGGTDGQIGATQGETYADACLAVYQSLARAGVRHLVTVTKNPTRDGKLRRLDQMTARLLRQAGYRIVAHRRAWLWETQAQREEREAWEQVDLLDAQADPARATRPVGRISFFKRLQLAKGSPAAQWEDVLFAELVAPAEAPPALPDVERLAMGVVYREFFELNQRKARLTEAEAARYQALAARVDADRDRWQP